MFDRVERLKSEWTDKYVVIDSPAPELARFARATGLVRTVNMNGRCLVEFDQFNNTGWYDIDPSALRAVPKPLPKPAEAKPAKAAAAKPAPAAKPAAAAKAAPTAGAKKPSTADILAAARGKAAAPAGKPSTADILARARGAAAPAAPAATPEPASEPEAEPEPAPAPAAKAPAKPAGGALPTTTADKIAWCRARDAKG